MGPRSCERGNDPHHAVGRSLAPGFNGAAFVRTRKYPSLILQAPTSFSLQWGRVRANAEIVFRRQSHR